MNSSRVSFLVIVIKLVDPSPNHKPSRYGGIGNVMSSLFWIIGLAHLYPLNLRCASLMHRLLNCSTVISKYLRQVHN